VWGQVWTSTSIDVSDSTVYPSYVNVVVGSETADGGRDFTTQLRLAEPVVTEPAATEPAVTEPVVTDPVVTEPVVTDPVVTDPVVTDPVVTDPVVIDPAVPGPLVSEHVVIDPVKVALVEDKALAIVKTLEALYATALPTAAELEAVLGTKIAVGFLEEGRNAADLYLEWSSGGEGPVVGTIFDSVTVLRAMGTQTYDGQTLSEIPADYSEGYWCMMTISEGAMSETFLTSFVVDSAGDMKWSGDRNIFEDGGGVDVMHVQEINGDVTSFYSGLQAWTEDIGTAISTSYGIDTLLVMHPALPDMGAIDVAFSGLNGILLGLNGESYAIAYSLPPTVTEPSYWGMVTPAEGLNIAGLTAGDEFIIVAADSSTGEVKSVWIDILGAPPIPSQDLTPGHFPVISVPDLTDPSIDPSNVTVSWTMPALFPAVADWMGVWVNGWDDLDNFVSEQYEAENPVWGQPWTSTTLDVSGTSVTVPSGMGINIGVESQNGREFETSIYMEAPQPPL
jgi:hypothetical protein